MDPALGVSIIALLLSGIALWRSQLQPFDPIVSCGTCTLRAWKYGTDTYVIVIDMPIAIANAGARPGRLVGLRLRFDYPTAVVPSGREYVYPSYVVDYGRFNTMASERDKWLEQAVIADWYPPLILSKTVLTSHVVFEAFWKALPALPADDIPCILEIARNNRRWQNVARWLLQLNPEIIQSAIGGASFSFAENSVPSRALQKSANAHQNI